MSDADRLRPPSSATPVHNVLQSTVPAWMTLQCQRISIALHTACAWDIQEELTLALADGAGHAAAA